MKSLLFISLLFLGLISSVRSGNSVCISNSSRIVLQNFITSLTNNDTVSVDTLKITLHIDSYSKPKDRANISDCSRFPSEKTRRECLHSYCTSLEEILSLHSIPKDDYLTAEDIYTISPDLLYQISTCNRLQKWKIAEHNKKSPPSEQAWGFGFLCVTIINVCSLSGAVVLPCMKRTFYQKVLIFMVALAVGSLAASGLLVLIPEALGLMYTEDHEISDYYIWKASTVFGGIYLFFLIERFLKIFLNIKQTTKHSHGHEYYEVTGEPSEMENHFPSIKRNTPINVSQKYKNTSTLPAGLRISQSESSFSSTRPLESTFANASSDTLDKVDEKSNGTGNGHSVSMEVEEKKPVATVAWMIIFGDGLHNFIDGLTIGAAFTDSILAGVSICVSVFCEELPHELGDFAILLNSGLSVKKALLFNFLSACMCYLGLIVGTILGENTSAHDWVFAIAGGMFLYISLVDMMPEMNSAAESEENKESIGPLQIFLLQNVGLLAGFSVILIMAIYGGEINFEK